MTVRTSLVSDVPARALPRGLAVAAGALLVALGAQVAVPIPGTPVPMTLQVPAVLIVGGLLGPRLGAASMVLYLLVGMVGVPVFNPIGPPGMARLVGPTGGYLLSYPLAAGLVGLVMGGSRSWGRLAAAVVAGFLVIHAGGVAQLAVLGGDLAVALRLGSIPFLAGDGLKLLVAALIIHKCAPSTRALT